VGEPLLGPGLCVKAAPPPAVKAPPGGTAPFVQWPVAMAVKRPPPPGPPAGGPTPGVPGPPPPPPPPTAMDVAFYQQHAFGVVGASSPVVVEMVDVRATEAAAAALGIVPGVGGVPLATLGAACPQRDRWSDTPTPSAAGVAHVAQAFPGGGVPAGGEPPMEAYRAAELLAKRWLDSAPADADVGAASGSDETRDPWQIVGPGGEAP
jgi:hypothetical protein